MSYKPGFKTRQNRTDRINDVRLTADWSGSTVLSRFMASSSYASDAWDTSLSYLQKFANTGYSINWKPILIGDVESGIGALSLDKPSKPNINVGSIKVPTYTESVSGIASEIEDAAVVAPEDLPDYNIETLSVTIPPAPDIDWPTLTATAPVYQEVTVPSAPHYSLPELSEKINDPVSIPVMPEWTAMSFNEAVPTIILDEPGALCVFAEEAYNTNVLTTLREKFETELLRGGTGLDIDTEQAMWDRAISRDDEQAEQAFNEALNFWASRGFSMPPGMLNGAILEARDRASRRREDLNNDILVQQSKLAQDNSHFIVTQAIAFEQALMNHANNVNTRAFESAKHVAEFGLRVFQSKVERYNLLLSAYKIKSEIFDLNLKAELAKVEFFKNALEGVRLETETKKMLVDIYQSQLNATSTLFELYKTEMEGAKLRSSIEKDKIDVFKAHIDAYVAEINAGASRLNAYQAEVAGESEKTKVFIAQNEAYGKQVDAAKKKSDVLLANAQMQTEVIKARATQLTSLVDKYKADVSAAVSSVEARVEGERLEVSLYAEQIKELQAKIDARIKDFLGRIELMKTKGDLSAKEAEVSVKALLGECSLRQEASQGAAQIASSLAVGALSSCSASASIGSSHSNSASISRSDGVSHQLSDSTSNSTSNSHSDGFSSSESYSETTIKSS